ncbi:hypothetical protein QBC37DRAFT_342713 [Rhypophila decipiens]|uniref:Extracellular membrane protein CFEM domain-containing protein n=1 Tax=Rhypophila decipiens TaxID=261697 RepID=A0AAN7B8D3_9PEZI|nr:hypothetical protein QBC37DRAFT_342713 [Rhypophila decipiens]
MLLPLLLAISLRGRQLANAAEITAGPEAAISIDYQPPWSSARACAAGCLKYNGVFGCNNAGFYDLGVALGCGCRPSNNCFCSAKFASSVTSYVVECASTNCDGIQDWADEATSMLGIYGDYCATANVAVSTEGFSFASTTSTATTPTETGKGGSGNPTRATQTGSPGGAASTSTETGTPAGSGEGEKKDGLSQSDIVALAASLGVGIPSLLVAIITLVVQMRRRKNKRAAAAAQNESGGAAAASNVHLIHLHTNTGGTPTPVVHHPPPPPPQYQTPPPQGQQGWNTTTWSYELDGNKEGNQRYEMK